MMVAAAVLKKRKQTAGKWQQAPKHTKSAKGQSSSYFAPSLSAVIF